MIARIEIRKLQNGRFEISRRNHRGHMVTLPGSFDERQKEMITEFAYEGDGPATWEQWKRFLKTFVK